MCFLEISSFQPLWFFGNFFSFFEFVPQITLLQIELRNLKLATCIQLGRYIIFGWVALIYSEDFFSQTAIHIFVVFNLKVGQIFIPTRCIYCLAIS